MRRGNNSTRLGLPSVYYIDYKSSLYTDILKKFLRGYVHKRKDCARRNVAPCKTSEVHINDEPFCSCENKT